MRDLPSLYVCEFKLVFLIYPTFISYHHESILKTNFLLFFSCCILFCHQHPESNIPDDSSILWKLAEHGGATGQLAGYTLYTSGQFIKWQKLPHTEPTITSHSKLSDQEIQSLMKSFESSGIQSQTIHSTANLTTTLTFQEGDSVKSWSWPGGGSWAQPPQCLSEWLRVWNGLCREKFQEN
jgi:hypothetical protein